MVTRPGLDRIVPMPFDPRDVRRSLLEELDRLEWDVIDRDIDHIIATLKDGREEAKRLDAKMTISRTYDGSMVRVQARSGGGGPSETLDLKEQVEKLLIALRCALESTGRRG